MQGSWDAPAEEGSSRVGIDLSVSGLRCAMGRVSADNGGGDAAAAGLSLNLRARRRIHRSPSIFEIDGFLSPAVRVGERGRGGDGT